MSRQQSGGGGGEVARGAGYAAFLGALLIGVAVIIGIVLLQIGDRGDNGPAGATAKSNTTTTKPAKTTTTHKSTPTVPKVTHTPSQVKLLVLNGGAPSGAAGRMAAALKRKGYTNQDAANTWTGRRQTGNTVYCRIGRDRDGAALAVAVGARTTLHVPFPAVKPPFSASDECVVVVGS